MALTEAEITAQNLANIEKPESTEARGDNEFSQNFGLAKEHHPLYEQFGVDHQEVNPRIDEIMGKIWEYAKFESAGKDKDSIVFEVIKLKNRLGSASLGEKPWSKVLNYVTYWGQMREADRRMRELENGKG